MGLITFNKTKAAWGLGLTAAYTVLALLMYYPLIGRIRTFAAGYLEDGSMSVWTLWWMKFSLMDLGQNPLDCQYLFYPDGTTAVFHSIPKALALISIPLQYLFGLTAAYNLVYLFTFVGTALAAYLLIYHLTGERLAAFMGAAFFAFSPYRSLHAYAGHLALLSTIMIPAYILMLFRGKDELESRPRRAWLFFTLAGLALGIQSYETEHYTISLLILTAIYLLFQLALARDRSALRRWLLLCLGALAAALISFLLYLPVLLAARAEIASEGDFVTFPIRETYRGADLLSYFVPDWTSPYLADAFQPVVRHFAATETSFLGWTVLILALVGLWSFRRNRQVWFWVISGILFASLALGPYLVVYGEMKHVAGPFLLLQKIPLLNSTRVPVRFSLFAALAASVLAGYGISAILGAVKKGAGDPGKEPRGGLGMQVRQSRLALAAVTVLLATLLFLEYKPPVFLTSTATPAVYREIAASGTAGSVLVVPLGWEATPNASGNEMTFVQLYQPEHMRPMIGGMIARAPKEKSIKGVYTPVLDFLAEPAALEPSSLDKSGATLNHVMDKYQIAFIVIHKVGPETYVRDHLEQSEITNAQTLARLDNYITGFLQMEPFADTDEYVAYHRKPGGQER